MTTTSDTDTPIQILVNDTALPDGTPLQSVTEYYNADVLCGRGGGTNHHTGNNHWRALVTANKRLYISLPKKQKLLVSKSIVHAIRNQKPRGGRFLRRRKGHHHSETWDDIGDLKATEKTSQALREGAPHIRTEMNAEKMESQNAEATHIVPHISPADKPGQILPNGLITLEYEGVSAAGQRCGDLQDGTLDANAQISYQQQMPLLQLEHGSNLWQETQRLVEQQQIVAGGTVQLGATVVTGGAIQQQQQQQPINPMLQAFQQFMGGKIPLQNSHPMQQQQPSSQLPPSTNAQAPKPQAPPCSAVLTQVPSLPSGVQKGSKRILKSPPFGHAEEDDALKLAPSSKNAPPHKTVPSSDELLMPALSGTAGPNKSKPTSAEILPQMQKNLQPSRAMAVKKKNVSPKLSSTLKNSSGENIRAGIAKPALESNESKMLTAQIFTLQQGKLHDLQQQHQQPYTGVCNFNAGVVNATSVAGCAGAADNTMSNNNSNNPLPAFQGGGQESLSVPYAVLRLKMQQQQVQKQQQQIHQMQTQRNTALAASAALPQAHNQALEHVLGGKGNPQNSMSAHQGQQMQAQLQAQYPPLHLDETNALQASAKVLGAQASQLHKSSLSSLQALGALNRLTASNGDTGPSLSSLMANQSSSHLMEYLASQRGSAVTGVGNTTAYSFPNAPSPPGSTAGGAVIAESSSYPLLPNMSTMSDDRIEEMLHNVRKSQQQPQRHQQQVPSPQSILPNTPFPFGSNQTQYMSMITELIRKHSQELRNGTTSLSKSDLNCLLKSLPMQYPHQQQQQEQHPQFPKTTSGISTAGAISELDQKYAGLLGNHFPHNLASASSSQIAPQQTSLQAQASLSSLGTILCSSESIGFQKAIMNAMQAFDANSNMNTSNQHIGGGQKKGTYWVPLPDFGANSTANAAATNSTDCSTMTTATAKVGMSLNEQLNMHSMTDKPQRGTSGASIDDLYRAAGLYSNKYEKGKDAASSSSATAKYNNGERQAILKANFPHIRQQQQHPQLHPTGVSNVSSAAVSAAKWDNVKTRSVSTSNILMTGLKVGKNDASLLDDDSEDDEDDKPMEWLSSKRKHGFVQVNTATNCNNDTKEQQQRPTKKRCARETLNDRNASPSSSRSKESMANPAHLQSVSVATNLNDQKVSHLVYHSPSLKKIASQSSKSSLHRGVSFSRDILRFQQHNDVQGVPSETTSLDRGHSLAMSEISLERSHSIDGGVGDDDNGQFDDASEDEQEDKKGVKTPVGASSYSENKAILERGLTFGSLGTFNL